MALGSAQSLTEMNTRSISWGQRRPVRKADNLPSSWAIVMKSGNLNFLESSGSLQASNGTALPLPLHTTLYTVGRDDSVGIATGYGLDGPGIEYRRWLDFPHLSRPALGPTQPPVLYLVRCRAQINRLFYCVLCLF